MIRYNPFTFEERVQKLIAKYKSINIPLEEVKPRIGFILLLTDEDKKIHVYVNGKRHVISGQVHLNDTLWLSDRLEAINKSLKKQFHIIKVESFLPFSTLRKLYFPRNFIPKQRDYHKRLFKVSRS